MGPSNEPHGIVSVETNEDLMEAGTRIVRHAISDPDHIMHTPLLPGVDTTFAEILETLRDNYEFPSFDFVLLAGSRQNQLEQLEDLLNAKLLRHGAHVHAHGPGRDAKDTEKYLEVLQGSFGTNFESEVHDSDDGAMTVVSMFQSHDEL